MLLRSVPKSLSCPSDDLASLVFEAELSLACTYSIRRPRLAAECARKALNAATGLRRPDLAWRATELLSAIAR